METIKRICRMCKPHAKYFWIGFVCLILADLTRLIAPLISGWMVDDVIKGGLTEKLWPLCWSLLGLTLLRAMSNYIRGVTFEKM